MKRYIISVDQSTSASKVMLVDELGKIVKKVSYGHHQSFPKPGWRNTMQKRFCITCFAASMR